MHVDICISVHIRITICLLPILFLFYSSFANREALTNNQIRGKRKKKSQAVDKSLSGRCRNNNEKDDHRYKLVSYFH